MLIKFDPDNDQIKIDDNLKFQYWMLKFVMVLNIFNMLLNVWNSSFPEWGMLTWFWISIGLASLLILFYLTQRSTTEVIPLEEIESLIHKDFFGRKRLSLKLKNGKTRHIPTNSIKEMEQIQNFINSPQKTTT